MKIRNKFRFGRSSTRRKETVCKYLQITVDRALLCSPIDFGVPWMGGLRTKEQQRRIYNSGNSRADGFKILSFHQMIDIEGLGLAIDLVPYVDGLDYSAFGRFGIIGMLMLEAWEELQYEGMIPHDLYLHCGFLWPNKYPSRLGWDLAHYEVREEPQIERV